MARMVWTDHDEMKAKFKFDVKQLFGSESIFIPNELRITGTVFSFIPDGLILSYDGILNIIFPEFKTLIGTKDRKGTFFQLGKYNVIREHQRNVFISITDKLKNLQIDEFRVFIEKHLGSYDLFFEIRKRLEFSFEACLIIEKREANEKDTKFYNFINETLPHVSIQTYNCKKEYEKLNMHKI